MRKDPGKRVDAWLPTWLWKRLRLAADRKGLTLGYAVADAIMCWCDEQDARTLDKIVNPTREYSARGGAVIRSGASHE